MAGWEPTALVVGKSSARLAGGSLPAKIKSGTKLLSSILWLEVGGRAVIMSVKWGGLWLESSSSSVRKPVFRC